MKPDEPVLCRASDERRLDRRRFLGVAGAAAAVTLGGEWLGTRLERARARTLVAEVDPAALVPGESRALADPLGGEVLAVRLDAETVVAFDRRCPHLGCPVLWSPERFRFECPCHHAAFAARTGEVLFGPPRRGLAAAALQHSRAGVRTAALSPVVSHDRSRG